MGAAKSGEARQDRRRLVWKRQDGGDWKGMARQARYAGEGNGLARLGPAGRET